MVTAKAARAAPSIDASMATRGEGARQRRRWLRGSTLLSCRKAIASANRTPNSNRRSSSLRATAGDGAAALVVVPLAASAVR